MRVKFTPPTPEDAAHVHGADALRVNWEYTVLEVYCRSKATFYRLEHTAGEDSALFDSRLFTVTCSKMPQNWHFKILESGSIFLTPSAWTRPGFWEEYYDHSREALRTYEAEKQIIYESARPHGNAE